MLQQIYAHNLCCGSDDDVEHLRTLRCSYHDLRPFRQTLEYQQTTIALLEKNTMNTIQWQTRLLMKMVTDSAFSVVIAILADGSCSDFEVQVGLS